MHLYLNLASSSVPCPSLKPFLVSTSKLVYTYHHSIKLNQRRRVRNGTCRAEFSQDAPIGVAIGACILNSMVFPIISNAEGDEGDSVVDSTDARFAVMGIISFVPYFNWLSWVFAWLDTGKRRYAVYAIVYLAPYLRSNLSLSPEDSWLPIASILFCILHVQLEVSIANGDLLGFKLFSNAAKHLSLVSRRKGKRNSGEENEEDRMNLPSAQEQSRDEIRGWRVPSKPSQHPEHSSEDENDEGNTKDSL